MPEGNELEMGKEWNLDALRVWILESLLDPDEDFAGCLVQVQHTSKIFEAVTAECL